MGYVYFLKQERLSPIKIGMSNDVKKRIASLKTGAPYGIELLGIIQSDNASELEITLHRLLSDVRLNGEWFDIDRIQAEELIKKYSSTSDERRWIKFDIPFDFDYRGYYLNELKVLRCFYYCLPFDKEEFNFKEIKKMVRKKTDIPDEDITYENMLNSFNEYYMLMEGDSGIKVTLGKTY